MLDKLTRVTWFIAAVLLICAAFVAGSLYSVNSVSDKIGTVVQNAADVSTKATCNQTRLLWVRIKQNGGVVKTTGATDPCGVPEIVWPQ